MAAESGVVVQNVLDVDHSGWFTEKEVMWPGQRMSLQVEKVLARVKSDYQDILVFQSSTYGRVLVLDGVIQLTERDEHSYQECIAHIPLFAHSAPRRVLIVGGGDGGVLREVCKHACVEEIVMCEIDAKVVDMAKEWLGDITATSFDDPRVNLLFQDAAEYVKGRRGDFDVVIMDSSDPVGPAESLYQDSFLGSVRGALAPGGTLCLQGECQWLHADFIADTLKSAATHFEQVDYAFTGVPTYPCGQIGFILASGPRAAHDPAAKPQATPSALRNPARVPSAAEAAKLRYYTPALHKASFVLPAFMETKLAGVLAPSVSAASPWHLPIAVGIGAVLGGLAYAALRHTVGCPRHTAKK